MEEPVAELEIEEVGDRIFRLPLPIPFEVGPVNAYLIAREEPALIDCGPRTDEAHAALLGHLSALEVDPGALRHIVITHSHVDHNGNVKRVSTMAPAARIHAHEADARPIFEHDEHMLSKAAELRRLVAWWGYPPETHDLAVRGYMSFRKYAESLGREKYSPVEGDEQDLAIEGARLRAIHCPGHTEGLICLLLEEGDGALFASDHILERITPNPTVYIPPYRGRRSGLADYVESLRRVRDQRVARVFPGHGPAFEGLARRVDEILEHHEHRKTKVIALLAEGPATILELVYRVWPKLADAELYLACREIQGHLDLLIEEKRAREVSVGETPSRFCVV